MVGQLMFTVICIFGGTYFFYLAIKWPRIIAMWNEHEKIFLIPPYSNKIKNNFVLKIRLYAFALTILGLMDHYIYFVSAVEKTHEQLKKCDEGKKDFWKIFYVNERQVLYTLIPYYSWQIPFLEWYEVVKTMCWTFSEIFVTSVSIVLSTRFQQLTNRLKFYERRFLAETFWHEIRCHYNILCNLVLKADHMLSPFILVYSFGNLFFICQKIFTQFERNKLTWERYYSYYSSVFLICRTIAMLCYTASVNEKSREALQVLREVPDKSFHGLDVSKTSNSNMKTFIFLSFRLLQYRRLLDVIHSNKVALSGCHFFYVTRGMILTVSYLINFNYFVLLII